MSRLQMPIGCVVIGIVLGFGPAVGFAQGTGTTVTGASNEFNPAISLNGLLLGVLRDQEQSENGFKLQEVEIAFTTPVDAFFTAGAFLAWEPASGGPEAEVVVEEVYADALGLPAGVGLRAGRFYTPFGRQNQLHAHAYPLIEAPLSSRSIVGEESAGDVGILAQYAPAVPFYLNLAAWGGDGAVEGVFDGEDRDLAFGGRVESLFDLGEAATLELASSLWDGPQADEDVGGARRTLVGADARVKWRDPRRTHGRALEWQAEVLADLRDADQGRDRIGLATHARYRLTRTGWVGAGYSVFSSAEGADPRRSEHEVRGQLTWARSEFSALRFEFVWHDRAGTDDDGRDLDPEIAALVQLNVTLGSHPAHDY